MPERRADAGAVRTAGPADAVALADLERDANLIALRHVFDPAEHHFPYPEVLRRWQVLLERRDVHIAMIADRALLAHDSRRVLHLAVHPDHWGEGLAGRLLGRAVEHIRGGGARPVLWCLIDNHQARGLYEHLGWTPTGAQQQAEFAPFPTAMEYRL